MNKNDYNGQSSFNLSSINQWLTDCLKAGDADMRPEAPVALAAVAYWRKLIALRIMTEEERDRRVRDDDTRAYLSDFAARYETTVRQAAAQFGVEELQAAILGIRPDEPRRHELPSSMTRLVLRLLDLREGESLLFVGGGFAGLIEEACISVPGVRLTVLEEDRSLCRILRIRAAVMGWPLEVLEGDIFSSVAGGLRADKLFLDAVESGRFGGRREELRKRLESDPVLKPYFSDARLYVTNAAVWAALITALSKQTPGGRTVAAMSDFDLKESRTKTCRERLVREGRIESVTALPEELESRRISHPYLLVCGEGASSVRMVDASDVYDSVKPQPPAGARGYHLLSRRTLTPENIETILERLHRDGSHSRLASPEELATRDFSLLPDAGLLADMDFYRSLPDDAVPLSDICRIYRGAVGFSGDADRFSDTPTAFQYLQLKDVQGGIIQGPLPFLRSIEKKEASYCAWNGVLVMGKNVPLRVGMLETPENAQVLLGGNIYAMEVTSAEYDPIYVMAYLQSADGLRQMNIFLGGKTPVQILPKNSLAKIKIPYLPIEKQRAVAEKYRALHAKLKGLLEDAEQVRAEMGALLG